MLYNKQKGFTLLYAVLVSSIVLSASLSIINIALKQHKLAALSRESKIAFYAANTGIDCALYWNVNTRTVQIGSGDIDMDIFPDSGPYDDPARIDDDQNVELRIDNDAAPQEIYCLGADIVGSDEFYGTDSEPIKMTYDFDTNNDYLNTNNDGKDPSWVAHAVLADDDLQEDLCLDTDNDQDYRTWIFQVILPNDTAPIYDKNNACAIVSVCKNSDPGTNGNGGHATVFTAKGYNTCDITKENVVERGIVLIQD